MTDVNGDGVAGGDPWLGAPVYRREFLRRMAIIGGGVLAGGTLLSGLACGAETPTANHVSPNSTKAPAPMAIPAPGPGETVSPDDPRIEAGPVEFTTAAAAVMGYLSRPKEGGPHPSVLVIHENRGMQPHFPTLPAVMLCKVMSP